MIGIDNYIYLEKISLDRR